MIRGRDERRSEGEPLDFYKQLRDALLGALRQHELALVVHDAWGVDLDQVAALPNPYETVVGDVISWATARDRETMRRLLEEARLKNSSNLRLRAVAWIHGLGERLPDGLTNCRPPWMSSNVCGPIQARRLRPPM